MKQSKIIWQGFSWFVAGVVVDLGLGILFSLIVIFPDVRWPFIVLAVVMLLLPFALSTRAIVREVRRQKESGLGQALPPSILDPVLGELVHEGDEWNGKASFGSTSVDITIYGEGLPDPILLQRAHSLVLNADQFLVRLAAFKEEQLTAEPRMARFADEVRAMTLSSVTFYDPPEPESGFITYSGNYKADRYWHSDLINNKPVGLSFDT